MKVCILTTAFPRWPGDHRAPFIYHAARAIRTAGNDVRVIAMHNPGALTRESLDGLEVIRPRYLPEKWEILQKDRGGIPSAWRSNPIARAALPPFLAVHTLAAARYGRDCDLIHANWTLSAMAAWFSAPIHRRPYVVTVHGSDIFQGSRIPIVRMMTRLGLMGAERIIAVSQLLAKAVTELGIPESKIVVIPDGVDVTLFHPPDTPRQPVILYAGSLTEQKGVQYLLHGFSQFSMELPGYRLVLVGDGPSRDQLERLASSLGIAAKVDFLSSVSQGEISQHMRTAALLVLPSLNEGLGVVLLESLASGTPCIATKAGGIPDIVGPDVGILIPPADPVALCAAMKTILTDSERYAEMSRNARQKAVDLYAWPKVAARITRLYAEVLEKTQRRKSQAF